MRSTLVIISRQENDVKVKKAVHPAGMPGKMICAVQDLELLN